MLVNRLVLTPFLLSAITIASFMGVAPAQADGNLNCDAYAKSVIEQRKRSLKLKCNFKGPAWSGNYQLHFNWCKQNNVKMANLTHEQRNRDNALALCAKTKQQASNKKKENAACGLYAVSAVKMIPDYNNACGKIGGKPIVSELKQACLQKGSKASIAELNKLGKEIKACKARTKSCGKYATEMVTYAKQNTLYNCRYKGGQFSNDSLGHRRWCLTVAVQTSTKISAETREAIRKCYITNVKVFKKPGGIYRKKKKNEIFLPIDGCSRANDGSKHYFCGKKNADLYCRRKGYGYSIGHKTAGFKHTWWQGSKTFCSGKCHGFTEIVCVRK